MPKSDKNDKSGTAFYSDLSGACTIYCGLDLNLEICANIDLIA